MGQVCMSAKIVKEIWTEEVTAESLGRGGVVLTHKSPEGGAARTGRKSLSKEEEERGGLVHGAETIEICLLA